MTLNKRINLRLSEIDCKRINALKQIKKGKKEVFNLSELIRYELQKHTKDIC